LNWYVTRDHLKRALDIPASSTARHALLGTVIEGVCRQIDAYVGFGIAPSCATRDYTALESDCLNLDYPLRSIDTVLADADDNSSYEITVPTSGITLMPLNATADGRPYWGFEVRSHATAVLPDDVIAGVRIKGTWGYTNETTGKAAIASNSLNASDITFAVVSATALEAGNTIIIDSERMFVLATPGTASGAHTSGITVIRGVNGTSGASHASNAAIAVYQFGAFEAAALFQSEQDYRAMDAPLGYAGAEPFGTQRIQTAPGGLHPFTRRMLDQYRMPVAL